MTNHEEGSSEPAWKRYPYRIPGGDAEMEFPAAEGDQGAESNTWYVAGRLRGRQTGSEWAFLVIFTANDIAHRLRADFYTLAIFDLAGGDYATFSEFDFPRPLRWRREHRLSVARGHLDLSFRSAVGRSTWRTRTAADGSLSPFDYHVDLHGEDRLGRHMRLDLDLDTKKPPLPVGGEEYGGTKTCIGQAGTHSYFQSDVRFSGTLEWGDVREEVAGDSGWIDRQWAPRYLGVHNDRRSRRYRHEWRQIHLDNGVAMSAWLHFDRHRGNRIIPFSGVTAADAAGRVAATTAFEVEPLSFVRDPGHVQPWNALDGQPAWLVDRYRLRVPEWSLDVVSEPLIAAPAHALPIEYWSGPTRVSGAMDGKPAHGFGFHERTRLYSRDFELVDVLRSTLRHLPDEAFPEGTSGLRESNRVWEVDAFLSHHDYDAALRHLRSQIRPVLERLHPPEQEHTLQIADDLEKALYHWWVRG